MKAIIWIVVVLILIGGGWWYFAMQPVTSAPTPVPTTTDSGAAGGTVLEGSGTDVGPADEPIGTSTGTPASVTVRLTAQGFSPANVTVKAGDKVTFINEGTSAMWIAADPHPSHEGYSGTTRSQHCPDTANTALDQCASGNTYTFTFTKKGTWQYHNHMNASSRGTVVVQ
jgi:plastocyanin